MDKEEFLTIAEGYYEEFDSLKKAPNFYEYEKTFVALWQRMGKEYMEKQLNASSTTADRRKKKLSHVSEKYPC